ncbi:MAG: hypothetical protein A2X18_11950 [Bacteroidetes bacterium GWF2_40_14]|nr:MAG: hypothetical protein A2X18_11950 [Bacteroidetes bacterium GWF2_40_14]
MKIKEVPQDGVILESSGVRDVCYAVDENGNYTQVISVGWEPKNDAINFAWEAINEESEQIKVKVIAGTLSPLAYHMHRLVMTPAILADYSGFSKREIKKFCEPETFSRLKYDDLHKLADALNISVEQLISAD